MIKRLIVFLIRKRLGLKLGQVFRFNGQKSDTVYWFDKDGIWRVETSSHLVSSYHKLLPKRRSGVSLTWLLDDDCEVDIWDETSEEWVIKR